MFLLLLLFFAKVYLVVIPALFRYTTVQRRLMFRNEHDRVVRSPERYGFKGAQVFYLNSEDNIRIGLWHIPPQGKSERASNEGVRHFSDGRLVVMYAHGAGGSRASKHRIALYRLLTEKLKLHVVTFDYRGFADSTYVWPTSEGTVTDASTVYRWIIEQGATPDRILLWGHSLGSGIVVRLLSSLPTCSSPFAAVLEAPFTTIKEVLQHCSISRLWNFLPYFESCFVERIINNPETNFDSVSLLDRVRCPLLILHARKDWIVDYRLGERLYQTAMNVQPKEVPRPLFYAFPSVHSHSKIVYCELLYDIIRKFIERNPKVHNNNAPAESVSLYINDLDTFNHYWFDMFFKLADRVNFICSIFNKFLLFSMTRLFDFFSSICF